LIADQNAPGTLAAAANYQKEMHFLFSSDFDKLSFYSDKIGNIRNWQFTGPFENLSESGFYKNYGPLEHPEPDAIFKSLTNADVKWFTPSEEAKDGWTPVSYQFNKNSAVVYAQNFVTSPTDQTFYCNVGFTGAIKVWINDELIISEAKELATEMDNYTVQYDLKKGVNRVLVQLSYTNLSYPCFCIRFTDKKFKSISNITGSSAYSSYPKNVNSKKKYAIIPHFAEKYFTDKLKQQPGNPVNYLLLADVYMRSNQLLNARNTISLAINKAPENSLLRMKMLEILSKENNRTLLLEELEKIKLADPESLLVFDLNIKELYNNEKYEDCAIELAKRIKLHGEDESTAGYQILLLIQDKKYDDLVKVVEKMYEKYPGNAKLVTLMYNIKKEVYKDKKAGLKIYESFMKNYYNYDTYINYADILIEQGDTKKGLNIKEKLTQIFKYDPNGPYNLSSYYFDAKQYEKAEEYLSKSLAISPYNEKLWEMSGDIKSEKKNVAEALNAYNQSLKFNPNQYNIISKIRKLNNKPEISKLFPEVDIDKVIKEDNPAEAKNTDYGYYYILDQKDVVVYPDGANEEYMTIVLKITNDKGVERYKESSIGYNNSQTLLIEKAEIIKKNQAKIEGERNDNEIVFTNLEVGDIIVFKYRLQSYVYGRFAKEFWDKYYFGGQIYSSLTKYNLLVPANQKINYVFTNSSLQPIVKNIEDFKQYSWILQKPQPIKDEPLMPLLVDAGNILHISTIPSWKEIADWYSDAVNNKS
jgi:tetratricopeptide (TPR) repeat protein